MKYLIFYSVMFLCISCNQKKHTPKVVRESIKIEKAEVRTDSLNEVFLKKAVYDTALYYNNSPSFEGSFLLNEKKLAFELAELKNIFSEEEQKLPILIKEVVWDIDKGTKYISVFYYEKEGVYIPAVVQTLSKDAQF